MHLAGSKIRQWREAHHPPLSADEFGMRYGQPAPWPSRTVYGWEAKGKIARASVQKRLAELGICKPADWLEPAYDNPDEKGPASMSGTDTPPFFDLHTHGFVRIATSTPKVRTADVKYNAQGIVEQARMADAQNVDLLLYPELSLSSYALDDLHLQSALLDAGVLDECTSAVSVEAEHQLYESANAAGISCITISQRLGLEQFHQTEIRFGANNERGWTQHEVVAAGAEEPASWDAPDAEEKEQS